MDNDGGGDVSEQAPGRPPVASGEEPPPAIRLTGITKRFPGVVANRDVNLTVAAGSIHALIGENGAGKSTLMKTLYGMHQPDEGTIEVSGTVKAFRSPAAAIDAGIGMVHQHFMLADQLTVAENIVLGAEQADRGVLNLGRANDMIRRLGKRHGLPLDPDRLVEELSVGERQRLEILKVLYRGARILILDEPTAVLIPQEVTELFTNLQALRDGGVTIVFISHKLDEVLEISDDITVMRAGTTVATVKPGDVDESDLGTLMVGSELPTPSLEPHLPSDTVALQTVGLTLTAEGGRRLLDDVDLTVHQGEIVGIAGVEGNGQQELIEALLGLRHPESGEMRLDGADLRPMSTRQRRDAGLGYVPTDRHREGLVLGESLWSNVMLGHQGRRYRRGPWLRRKAARADTVDIIDSYDVRTPGSDIPALALSGGERRRVEIARVLATRPRFILLDEPFAGVDPIAVLDIQKIIAYLRERNIGVLITDHNVRETLSICDHAYIINEGSVLAKGRPDELVSDENVRRVYLGEHFRL